MDNQETMVVVGMQVTERRQTQNKYTTQHRKLER